jgi:hypothetical protein
MVFKNPCNQCIILPCCSKLCNDKIKRERYITTWEDFKMSLPFTIPVTLFSAFTVWIWVMIFI